MRVYLQLGRKFVDYSFATERAREIEAEKLFRTRAIKNPDRWNVWINIDWIDFFHADDPENRTLYEIINDCLREQEAA